MKKLILILSFIALITVGISVVYKVNLRTLTADSGWDSDYGGGGSDWGGSSSWDSGGSDWGSSSSGSGGSSLSSPIEVLASFFIMFIIIVIIIAVGLSSSNKTSTRQVPTFENKDYLIPRFFPEYKTDEFIDKVYNIFVNVQVAWMIFDYDKLSKLCTDELYNSYKTDLEVLKLKNGKNIMNDFEKKQCFVTDIKEENNNYIVQVFLQVSFHDYVIDTTNNKVIRGNKNYLMHNSYLLEYVVSKNNKKITKCPNCGAIIKGRDCEFCNSHIDTENYDIVLSKKNRV